MRKPRREKEPGGVGAVARTGAGKALGDRITQD